MSKKQILVKRSIFKKVIAHLGNPEITLIIGPRQVGKTVLLGQMQEYLIKNKQISSELIFYFNLDIIKDRELFTDQTQFIDFIKQRSRRGKIFIFIDEAQKVSNAGVFFKGVYDSNLPVKLILTGSSNLEIRSKIHESLTGRKRVFHLLPFSFLEILNYRQPALYETVADNKKITDYDRKEVLSIFSEYCIFGGYPQVIMADDHEEKEEYLREIFTSYIEKDIIGFLRVENENNFNKLVKLLAAQIGNLINVAELSALVNTDRYTIGRYLANLEKTFIISNLMPYYSNKRQEIIKAAKVYFIDTGLRNLSLANLNPNLAEREDRGALLENAVLKELIVQKHNSNFSIKFWRSKQKAEVDFVIENGVELMPVEIKSNLKSNKLDASFLGFISRYKPPIALIVNLAYTGKRKINNTEVLFIFPWEINNYIIGKIAAKKHIGRHGRAVR